MSELNQISETSGQNRKPVIFFCTQPCKKGEPAGKCMNYSPGGMLMPNRSNSSDSYRFGMNGQEKDDEIAGNGSIYSAQYWEYDSRSIRRWNVDPVLKEGESPFACFAGNPILHIDSIGANATKYKDEKGETIADTKDGSTDEVTVPNSMLKEFKENFNATKKVEDGQQDQPGYNNYWKCRLLGFETSQDMENALSNTSSQWSRQKLIDFIQKPTLKNGLKFVTAEVLSQNANPLNHLPTPDIKFPSPVKVQPKIKVETKVKVTNSWIEFNQQMGKGAFTKERYGSSEAAAAARRQAYETWKTTNGK